MEMSLLNTLQYKNMHSLTIYDVYNYLAFNLLVMESDEINKKSV